MLMKCIEAIQNLEAVILQGRLGVLEKHIHSGAGGHRRGIDTRNLGDKRGTGAQGLH